MLTDKDTMVVELKRRCVPVLRRLGFKGSFPHLYRVRDAHVDLLNFQFYSAGGSFCINLSYADPKRANIYIYKDTEPKKLRVNQATVRHRLGAVHAGADNWFSYGETSYGENRGKPVPPTELCLTINQLLETCAESWWNTRKIENES